MSMVQGLVGETINNQTHQIRKIQINANRDEHCCCRIENLAAVRSNVGQNFSVWFVDLFSPFSGSYHKRYDLLCKFRLKFREVTEFWQGSCH